MSQATPNNVQLSSSNKDVDETLPTKQESDLTPLPVTAPESGNLDGEAVTEPTEGESADSKKVMTNFSDPYVKGHKYLANNSIIDIFQVCMLTFLYGLLYRKFSL